jgi:hypothetical protein
MRLVFIFVVLFALSGCATWSTSNVDVSEDSTIVGAKQKDPESVLVIESDISDRKYKILGDIEVTVNKTTIFHEDPTREMVNLKLKQEAAKLGADAVTFVRYGTVGMSLMSWGSLNGKGRAIVFIN